MRKLPETIYKDRFNKLETMSRADGFEALLIFSQAARMMGGTSTHGYLRYLLDWTSWGSPTLLFLPVGGPSVAIVPIPGEVEHFQEKVPWIKEVRFGAVNDYGKLAVGLMEESGIMGKVGLIGDHELLYPVKQDLGAGMKDRTYERADYLIDSQRMIKDETGINIMQNAAATCDTMFEALEDILKEPGIPAWRVQVEIERVGRARGAEIAWTWLASGVLPDRPRVGPDENARLIQPGDGVVVAIILVYQGYFGHAIRMFSIGGPSDGYRRVWACVQEAQKSAASQLKPGIGISQPNLIAEKVLFEHFPGARREDKIRFRPCHFIGLDYAEYPTAKISSLATPPRDDFPEMSLETNMTMEIHPNIRPAGLGFGAIGDIYVVTPDGGECLTKYPKEITIVAPK